MSALEKGGVEAWGQVAATRKAGPRRSPRRPTARGVRHVLVVRPEKSGWRLVVEGDVAKEVAHKLGADVTVEGVAP